MKRRLFAIILLAGLLALTLVSAGYTATLSFNVTADNAFAMYLSSDPYVQGTKIVEATTWDWWTTYSGSATVNFAPVQYLQVRGINEGSMAGFIGDFTLSSTYFNFANGTQSLVTNTAEWTVSPTGFNVSPTTPTDYGANLEYANAELGEKITEPWHFRPGISVNAHWIWTKDISDNSSVYFVIPIYDAAPVPVPPTALLLGSGLLGLVGWRRFRKS